MARLVLAAPFQGQSVMDFLRYYEVVAAQRGEKLEVLVDHDTIATAGDGSGDISKTAYSPDGREKVFTRLHPAFTTYPSCVDFEKRGML